jgi:hypothetical protein
VETPPLILPYRESLDRDELCIDEKDGVLRIITPLLKSRANIGYGVKAALVMIGTYTSLVAIAAIGFALAGNFRGFLAVGFYLGLMLFIYFAGSFRHCRAFVFELDANQLRIMHPRQSV